jgi:hypothetical protein
MPTLIIDNPSSKNDVANWAEFYICVSQSNLSKTELSSFLEASSGSEPNAEFIDDVWQELTSRESLYGDEPPYQVDSREIISKIDWQNFPEYLLCVILSIDGAAENSCATGKLFEKISCEAVKSYLGGNAIIYGFPHKQTLEEIASILNERFNYNPTSNFKDRGVDIIAWKSFDDSRKSQMVGLFQCAAGYNWKKKLLEVPIDAWRCYISWSSTLPFKGFVTPVVIDEEVFHETTLAGGLMIDRPRIYRYLKNATTTNQLLKSELITWCTEKITTINN